MNGVTEFHVDGKLYATPLKLYTLVKSGRSNFYNTNPLSFEHKVVVK